MILEIIETGYENDGGVGPNYTCCAIMYVYTKSS
jgi:hypothetical protein